MIVALLIASCGKKDEPTEQVEEKEKPEYGGTITLSLLLSGGTEPDFDLINWFSTAPQHLAHQAFWEGDWTKGPAGGYGTGEVLWEENTNVPDLNVGVIAESWNWVVNEADNTVTTTITVRDNVYFNEPDTEAGRIVGGRKMTVEDVQWCWQQHISNPDSANYQGFPMCRDFVVEKTGPRQLSITMPLSIHLDALMRYFAYVLVFPPELWDEYGYDSCTNIMYSVGTGPYYVTDYVISNSVTMQRSEKYWRTNPIGPGEGDKLPYADTVKYILIPDTSTQQSALRTAQIDMLSMNTLETMQTITGQISDIKSAKRGGGHNQPVFFRMDEPPFNDVRVRRAMQLAIDLNEINETMYAGEATLINFPYYYTPAYADLYLDIDEMEPETAAIFTQDIDEAKRLLTEAGYPNGFSTELSILSEWGDYYSIYKEYWSKIGVDVGLRILTDVPQLISVNTNREFEGMIACFISPCSTFPEQAQYTGDSWLNPGRINEPYVNEMADNARAAGVTSLKDAMAVTKELTAFLHENVYAIQAPHYPNYNMWWPWLKNYTGEVNVGYMVSDTWVQYVWVDQALKKSMGH
jgi:peptide/nickel transport system substrate-binding protein